MRNLTDWGYFNMRQFELLDRRRVRYLMLKYES